MTNEEWSSSGKVDHTTVERLRDNRIMNRDHWVFEETNNRDTVGLLYYFDRGEEE